MIIQNSINNISPHPFFSLNKIWSFNTTCNLSWCDTLYAQYYHNKRYLCNARHDVILKYSTTKLLQCFMSMSNASKSRLFHG